MIRVVLLVGLLAAGGFGGWSQARAADKPNVVFIVADDLGLECVQAYGGLSYRTPNLDKLAATGMRFTHCFSNPLCSPSRGELLTGRYPLHNGIPRVIYDFKNHREFLDPQKEVTFAKLLKQNGYATAIAGKWQLSFLHERDTIRDHGFDEYQCWQIFYEGDKTSRYANPTMRENGKVRHKMVGRYGPDENLAFLIDFIKRHRDQPFCVYYTCLLPHYPWEPTPDSGVPLKPAADGAGNKDRYFPDMVAYLDKQVGQMVAALDEMGLRENTLVLFVGDNGTDQRIISKWTDGQVTRNVHGGKGSMTDAGTRVPLIANWPGVIEPGRVTDQLVDFSDLLPTIVEVTGSGASPNPINGISFLPTLRGQPMTGRSWVHIQDHDKRQVRNRDYIYNTHHRLRPVVEIGQKRAKAYNSELTPEQAAARDQLKAALQTAADFKGPR
ncbi:sulfatase-like hydrolase/transferase [Planctomycetales bacterium ZRK34]|nr:sulfatase-like hydrolase/transferase [Planctomycetales bacterium ZRK34]